MFLRPGGAAMIIMVKTRVTAKMALLKVQHKGDDI
jgi:hypothetical protein